MSNRAYILLDILETKAAATIQSLRSREGVVAVDPLEGHPNFLLIVEAPDRQKLVESIIPVLSSIERITEDLRLLLIRENYEAASFFSAGNSAPFSITRRTKALPKMPVNSLVS
jgi:hypothetical protein